MDRLTLTARLRLVPTDAGGRKTPIRSNYRPTFDLGGLWMGKPAVNDGRIMLIEQDELAPGAKGLVRIEPMFSEFWATARGGAVVPVQEGARVVGHVTVEQVQLDDRILIEAKARNAVAMMAHPEPLDGGGVNYPEPVLAKGGEWLRLQDSNLRPGG